jgi:hypothetical protein
MYDIMNYKVKGDEMKYFSTAVYNENGVTKTKSYSGKYHRAHAEASAKAFNGYYTVNTVINGLVESEIKGDYRRVV